MTDAPKIAYAQAALTEEELSGAMEAMHALVLFPAEMCGLARILDQLAEEHPDAADDLAKVAQAIRIGSEFAQKCNNRITTLCQRKGSLLSEAKGGVQ